MLTLVLFSFTVQALVPKKKKLIREQRGLLEKNKKTGARPLKNVLQQKNKTLPNRPVTDNVQRWEERKFFFPLKNEKDKSWKKKLLKFHEKALLRWNEILEALMTIQVLVSLLSCPRVTFEEIWFFRYYPDCPLELQGCPWVLWTKKYSRWTGLFFFNKASGNKKRWD